MERICRNSIPALNNTVLDISIIPDVNVVKNNRILNQNIILESYEKALLEPEETV